MLNALSGRLPKGGVLQGEVLVNGLPPGRGFRMVTAYVQQVGRPSCLLLFVGGR